MSELSHFRRHRDFIVPPNPPPPPGAGSLFERLGGRPGVSRLVKWFYARSRYDELLEPIFRAHITDWARHIPMLIEFWVRMTGGPSTYSGRLAASHRPLALKGEHFDAWLRWWDRTCDEVLAQSPAEAAELKALARRLADQMQRANPPGA